MTIPLDRLYHYIEQVAEETYGDCVLIYRFYPHGSKKIEDLLPLHDDYPRNNLILKPLIYCNDQEPLNFNAYDNLTIYNNRLSQLIEKHQLKFPNFNFQQHGFRINIYDKSLLIHSEKRSAEVKKYQDNYFIPVYYWSHAIIARDWFRYAQHVTQNKQVEKLFLVYNRAWSGTREYRLKFADLLIDKNLLECCKTNVNVIEPDLNIHYDQYKFQNQQWQPLNALEKYFSSTNAQSYLSADFDFVDYEKSAIEVVLETLFDDSRLHLTEKILRPIACGQPFVLAGTAGSLEYLRSYGFKTFENLWDESYDSISDSFTRLNHIVNLMQEISQWCPETRHNKIQQAQQIAEYNKRHFFSEDFFSAVLQEFKINLRLGLQELEDTNTSKIWFDRRKKLYQIPEVREKLFDNGPDSPVPGRTRQEFVESVFRARQYYLRSLNKKNNL